MKSFGVLVCLMALPWATAAAGSSPPVDPKELPRVPPVEAGNVLQTFQIRTGFQLQLVASEPLVLDPIALAFDEMGRMFVVEMRDYSEMREVHPHLGRIRMLEDTNADGIFDKATIYADDLPWPTGVICYDGGIFVAASPDIIYFKDTNGDGKADLRKVVFTGFGAGKGDKLNVQALLNSLVWGLDNRIHGQTAGNGGAVIPAEQPGAPPVHLSGRDFVFDPRTLKIEAESGGGQYGMCCDNHGRRFVCSNSHHIQTFMYEARYGERNRYYNMPPPLVDIAVDGPAAEVYRISPEEQWRVIRTKWRVAGQVPGPIEGGGRASGYFTSATGISIYRGNSYPEENLGDAFVADCGSNLVHRKRLRIEGVTPVAERPGDEQKSEFLASKDLWFRPVQMANGPDGTMYIADMYREIIEHPWSLPETIKALLDLNAGNDRGRVYRIIPEGFKQPAPVRLGRASTPELVTALEHPNGWHRDTAARLLYQRQDQSAVPLLRKLAQTSKSPLARLHVLHALDGLSALAESDLLRATRDPDPWVREHAIRLSEKFAANPSPELWARLQQLAGDPAINVRYQLAFTLGEFKSPDRIKGLAAIGAQDMQSSWIRAAILSSLSEGAGELFQQLASNGSICESKPGKEFLSELVRLVGIKNRPDEIARVMDFIGNARDLELSFSSLRSLAEGLRQSGGSLATLREQARSIFTRATECATDIKAPEPARIAAIQLLGQTDYLENGARLLGLLNQEQSQAVQLAAVSTLSHFNAPQLGPELLKRWELLTPRLRSETLAALLARPDRALVLLQAISEGIIRPSVLDSTQTKFLLNHRDKAVHDSAEKALTARPAGTRQQVIDSFVAAITLKGDLAHGKKIYEERCLSCHRLGGEGFALGPDLVTVKNTGREKLLTNILDPNREVRPEYVGYLVETRDDESFIGLIGAETGMAITLRQAYGKEDVLQRSNIRKMQSQGQSLMPEGLEAGLTPQHLADLLEYIEKADAK